LAYVFGRRQDEAFLKLKALLEPFGITKYYTDYWGAYTRHIDPDEHQPGKRNTQKIERKHLTLRARIKRLARKTICFSKSVQMHDIVIGLFVNGCNRAIPRIWATQKLAFCNGKSIAYEILAEIALDWNDRFSSYLPANR
jgi:insertion element IS1 protein InsB